MQRWGREGGLRALQQIKFACMGQYAGGRYNLRDRLLASSLSTVSNIKLAMCYAWIASVASVRENISAVSTHVDLDMSSTINIATPIPIRRTSN